MEKGKYCSHEECGYHNCPYNVCNISNLEDICIAKDMFGNSDCEFFTDIIFGAVEEED